MAVDDKVIRTWSKPYEKYSKEEVTLVQKNPKDKKILICGIGLNEYDRISTYEDTKRMWEAL